MPATPKTRAAHRPAPATARPARAGAILPAWLDREIRSLYPGSFALVMATGIISNALFFEGRRGLSDALFIVNTVAYPWLVLATLIRAARHHRALWADLVNPRLVFSFFTIVAASGVFGIGLNLRGHGAIVGTESLVILGAFVAQPLGALGTAIFVGIHMLWGIVLALYGIFIVLFAHRIFFLEFEPDDITPLLWVVMGAAAISTNAGSMLLLTESGLPFLDSMRPFIDGVTLITWAWGTWWIPLLVLFGIWKHGVCRVPLAYTPMLWSLVFPLGMYALASLRLSLASDYPPLHLISLGMVWVALAAWIATAVGLVRATWRSWWTFER